MKAGLRVVLLALLGALLFGFALGTWLRLRMEKPVTYIGAACEHSEHVASRA